MEVVSTTTTRITATGCAPSSLVTGAGKTEYVTLDDVYEAYYDCRRRKRSKASALAFEMHYERELRLLWQELNAMTYEPGTSIVFAVVRPKLREVFAADFRDRVVHHLLMLRLEPLLESEMIDNSFNCRKGKGTEYGIQTLASQIREVSRGYTEKCYVLQCDLQGFFMSIDKDILWRKVEDAMRRKWTYGNLEWWLWLTRKIIYHRPEQKCEIHGNPRLLDRLPDHKTLFRSGGRGMPIGNLPSQIFVNYYLTDFDRMIISMAEAYGRYVDDFYIVGRDRKALMSLLPAIRERLSHEGLTLHPRKVSVTEAAKGVRFIGSVVRPWGVYVGNRTVTNAFDVAKTEKVDDMKRHVQRLNSYYGFMIHRLSYAIRRNLYEAIPPNVKKKVICVGMRKFVARKGRVRKRKRTNSIS